MVRKLKTAKTGANQMDIIKQAQAMQQEMLKIQEELKGKEVEASVGGGAVVVKANGQKEVLSISISEETIKDAVSDKEMLEDLVLSAVKEAMRQAEELSEKEMSRVTGGMNIPGLF
ncbi:MAG: YbaB/EbfC family nucleoid-associated protein [Fusobacterium perfoetens]|uniref:YbaB/EbfC family nucleoid-associated protein n=1 Tax=Fusobacterium perfoetens TaxID=852 RepID=UPI0023F27D01|nr:YbaB/EbfC family nucleoid-associated protein [Fusobacterium perfoetens]MCI6153235.1 YbaB/EbfC family nucleoid-associated protein [Fusobacterium perfoetens]MDY3238336.1 YbaB/EbfC family nucleoid-associated protein [Fusobacterium perfoetens]